MVSYFQSTRKLDFFSSHVKLATLKKKSSSPLNIQSYSTSESSNNSSKRSTESAIFIFSLVLRFVFSLETWSGWPGKGSLGSTSV